MSQIDLCSRLRLYVVIDPQFCKLDPVRVCHEAVIGGATVIQLRSKHSSDRETLEMARAMRAISLEHGALFIVNDRLDLALACGADGVHLGVDDLPVKNARSIAGDEFFIGYSPESDEQASAAPGLGTSYLGIGPVYGTASKDNAGPAIGLQTLARRRDLSRLPVVGIGGIDAGTARLVIDAGACGVAVMSAIVGASSPADATRDIAEHLGDGQPAEQ